MCGRNVEHQLGLDPNAPGDQSSMLVNERGHIYQPHFTLLATGHLSTTAASLMSSQSSSSSSRQVSDVACGGDFTLMYLSNDHEVVGMGQTRFGQLFHQQQQHQHHHNGQQQEIVVPTPLSFNTTSSSSSSSSATIRVEEERRHVLQLSSGFKLSGILFANSLQPLSLRRLCSNRIRSHLELAALIAVDSNGNNIGNGEDKDASEGQHNGEMKREEDESLNRYKEIVRSNLC